MFILCAGGEKYFKGSHPAMSEEEECDIMWLEEGLSQHWALLSIVNDTKVLGDLQRLNHFCHTGSLENFHSVLLKWCPKRIHYFFEGMRARTQLAAVYHNCNVGRQQAKTEKGQLRYRLVYPKSKGQWVVKKVYDDPMNRVLLDLMETAHETKRSMQRGKNPECIRDYEVPQDIPKNIAQKPLPDKEKAIPSHISRMSK